MKNWYCEKCKKLHTEDEMCPHIKKQLQKHPEWMTDIANFTTIAGEQALVSTQALDTVAKGVNKLTGSNLSFEGTIQYSRDIQVFKRLNEEAFSRSGVFSNPETAKQYFENVLEMSQENPNILKSFTNKLTGSGQEVDWLLNEKGKLTSLINKSELLNKNAPGVDGVTINRFTGKEISRTTIKASTNPITKNSTAVRDIQEALTKGNLNENDIIYGPKGMKEAIKKAGIENKVVEKNTTQQIKESNERLMKKIADGEATTVPTLEGIGQQVAQGAVIGAAVSITVSGITSYVRYKNGELTIGEAFSNVGEDALKGALVGAACSGFSVFLGTVGCAGGPVGFIAGFAVGLYVDKVCTVYLDEIFGKGAWGAILTSSGYVYGMTFNLADYYNKIAQNNRVVNNNIIETKNIQSNTKDNFDLFDKMK